MNKCSAMFDPSLWGCSLIHERVLQMTTEASNLTTDKFLANTIYMIFPYMYTKYIDHQSKVAVMIHCNVFKLFFKQ